MTPFAQNVVTLHGSEPAERYEPIASDSVQDVEPEAKPKSTFGAAPDEVDLDALMTKLRALAAKAQQLPSRKSNQHRAVMAAAIALSVTSGAVTGQYLIPGHSRVAAAPSKSFARATPRVAAPVGNIETQKR